MLGATLLLCGFFFPPFIPLFHLFPLTLDRKEERIEGREIPESIFSISVIFFNETKFQNFHKGHHNMPVILAFGRLT